MLDYIAYILVRGLNKILSVVPISVSLWIGRVIGRLVFFFNKKRRVIAYANLKAAFAKEKSPAELRGITKRIYQNMAQTFAEVLNLTKINKKYVDKYIQIPEFEKLENSAKSGKGTILLTGHFGDWELSSLVSSVKGYPILVLAREQKMKRLNELLNRLRESNGCKVIRKGMSTKNILRALYDKNVVGILSDQDAGKKGMFVNFFGRPTSCHSGPFEIAKHTNSIILPNFIVRIKGPYHKVYLEEYIDFNDGSGDVKDKLQAFTSIMESYVRKYPDQWLWLHKRWKSTPVRTILVLSDGKAGHLNQSLAVAGEIIRARATQGFGPADTKIVVADVKFKSNLHRAKLSLCAAFASWRCQGCMRCMKFCLAAETYDALMKTYSDFVISCGSSLAGVNIFMSKENNAKNIVIMKPNIINGFRKFDLAIVPRHDAPPKRKNIVETIVAPNLVDDEALKKDSETLRKLIPGTIDGSIGIFIGGDNPEYSLTKELANAAVDNICIFADSHGLNMLVTTSRRTSAEAEKAIKEKLSDNKRCKLLVIANENNFGEAVNGILGLSKVVVVSGESISMVSEAISSGKRVVVFMPDKKKPGLTKHETALRQLEKNGYLAISTPENLSENLEKALNAKDPIKRLSDKEKIFEAVRRLV